MINKIIANIVPLMPKKLVWIFSQRYIAGSKLEDAIRVSKQLNEEGVLVTIDELGEFIENLEEADKNRESYIRIIEETQKAGVKGNYSVKPTMFGLLIDKERAYQNIREIVKRAASYNNFVRIDMEDSQCTDLEIELYSKLKEEFPGNVGLVFQAYLKRTIDDLKNLYEKFHKNGIYNNYRLCKGIYVEPAKIAYKDKEEIRKHYLENLEFLLSHGEYVGIATHDKYLVESAYKLLEKYNVSHDMYEFQMLYGVTPELRKSIVKKGHKMRVYVPFGEDWFGYSTRRMKENPKIAGDITKALFKRG